MDINAIKNKLASLQQKPKPKYEKVDYTKIFWKPEVGKQIIRIVPSKYNDLIPFREIHVHYGINKFPMLALTNWGEKDPIVEFANDLKKTSNKEDWKMGKKLDPKMRVFAPVIVRGQEDLGVRLWEFGKEIYQELLSIAEDEDIGDYTSISNGRDITVDTVGPEVTGTKYNKSSVRVKPKTSPITEDKELLKKLLAEQPDILSVYKKFSFDEMKKMLIEHLEPTSEEVGDGEEEVEEEKVAPAATAKSTKTGKFDTLFN